MLATVTLIAGLTPLAARMATRELPPLSLAAVRFGLAGTLLAVTVRLMRLPWPPVRLEARMFLVLGAICVPVNQVCYLFGVKLANASHAGVAYAMVPVFVFWISVVLGRTSPGGRLILATSLASLGATVVVLATGTRSIGAGSWSETALWLLLGDGLLLAAAASWAMFVVLSQPVVRRFGAVPTLATVFLAGTLLQLPLVVVDAICFNLRHFDPSTLTWRGIAGFAYLTLITAYTNYLLWYLVVARYDVTRSAVVTNSNFLVTVLAEAALFDQRLSWWVAPGCLLLLAGIALANPTSKSTNAAPARA